MKTKHSFWLPFILVISSFTVYAQGKGSGDMESLANQYYSQHEYGLALPLYIDLDALKPGQGEYNFRIGYCYYNSHHKLKALPYFEKAKKLNYHSVEIDFLLGRAYHLTHKFDDAILHYRNYEKKLLNNEVTPTIAEEDEIKYEPSDLASISRYIEMCKVGKELIADSLQVEIKNMGPHINTPYADYGPVISADASVLMFTSRRPGTTGGAIDPQDGQYFEDIYVSTKVSKTEWTTPSNLNVVNTDFHDACIALSPDGHKLFIYRTSKNKKRAGDIYVSNLEGIAWSAPVILNEVVNHVSWETSISLSADQKTMYFSSDRPGGFGGTDIYMVKMQPNGHWGSAINLGPKINTSYDEDAPFIHPDNRTLTFSSLGHRTMGGFDIFISEFDAANEGWSDAKNMGYPINTADDDIYLTWSADGNIGYFSSWREDTYGEKDIYSVRRKGSTSNLASLNGVVVNKTTNQPIAATITITDNETHKVVGVYSSNSATGKYTVLLPHGKNYGISIDAPGYMFHSENINIDEGNPFVDHFKSISMDPVKVGSVMVLNNLFFDFDKATLKPESKTELHKIVDFLNEHAELKVELDGHTDSYGNNEYNQRLSEKRALAVIEYLASQGINQNRMVAKGYGESHPSSSNSTKEGRQLNRRTELKILDQNMMAYNGNANLSIQYTNEYHSNSEKENNIPQHITATEPEIFSKGSRLKPIVHFTHNNTQSLTDYSHKKLMEVVNIMKRNPTMKVRICAYADHVGSTQYNISLSEKRAETIFNLMVKEGIEESRLIQEVHGEENELVHTADVKGNLPNRRVEFIVVEK